MTSRPATGGHVVGDGGEEATEQWQHRGERDGNK
jgi:hypothetical protein